MGMYDSYERVQLKIGPRELNDYKLGEAVPLPDGIYAGLEGFIVVYDMHLLAVHYNIYTKWGDELSPDDVLDEHNPYKEALKSEVPRKS